MKERLVLNQKRLLKRADLQRTEFREQQILYSTKGIIICRACKKRVDKAEAVYLMTGNTVVYALCMSCQSSHEILMIPTEEGIRVMGKRLGVIQVVGG